MRADTVILYPVEDARIRTTAPDSNEGYLFSLAVYNDLHENEQRSLIRFDKASLPRAASIVSAKLRLTDRDLSYLGNNLPVSAYRVTTPWLETEITWNQPSNGMSWMFGSGGDFVGTSGNYNMDPYASALDGADRTVTLDVTRMVREWASGQYPNYGVLVRAPVGNYLHFHSRENAFGPKTVRPQLIIETSGKGSPIQVTPTLSWLTQITGYTIVWIVDGWLLTQTLVVTNTSGKHIANCELISAQYGPPAQIGTSGELIEGQMHYAISELHPLPVGSLAPGESREVLVYHWYPVFADPPYGPLTPLQMRFIGRANPGGRFTLTLDGVLFPPP